MIANQFLCMVSATHFLLLVSIPGTGKILVSPRGLLEESLRSVLLCRLKPKSVLSLTFTLIFGLTPPENITGSRQISSSSRLLFLSLACTKSMFQRRTGRIPCNGIKLTDAPFLDESENRNVPDRTREELKQGVEHPRLLPSPSRGVSLAGAGPRSDFNGSMFVRVLYNHVRTVRHYPLREGVTPTRGVWDYCLCRHILLQ